VKAILFDLDGTLTDTLPLVIASLNEALAPVWGGPRSESEIRRLFGPPEGRLIAQQAPDDPAAVERFYEAYRRLHAVRARVFPGVRPMLSTLWERGLRLGLVTNKGRRSTLITLEEFGLRRFFRTIVDGDHVEQPKPAPDGILLALRELGVTARDAAYVGDMPSDLGAAHAGGVEGWRAAWSRPGQDTVAWDFVAREPEDVLHHCLRDAAATT
jgi:phosphoglycolate phosphatase/pyrophosphatase PpaX